MARRIFGQVLAFFRRYDEHDISGSAAKATYYLLVSFFPLCLLLMTLFRGTNVLDTILPSSVAALLSDIAEPELAFQTTSVLIILWSASASIWALMSGIHAAYTGDKRLGVIQGRIRAVFLIYLLFAALLVCVSVTLFSRSVIDWLIDVLHLNNHSLLNALRIGLLIALIYGIVLCLYLFTPNLKLKAKAVTPGALLTAVGWVVATWGFEVYMGLFNHYSALYGSIGAFLGLTLWLYIISVVLLCGAEINVMLAEHHKRLPTNTKKKARK